jgi:hypothetical protein
MLDEMSDRTRRDRADDSGEASALALGGDAEGGRIAAEGEGHWIDDEVEWSWPVWGERVVVGAGAAGRVRA